MLLLASSMPIKPCVDFELSFGDAKLGDVPEGKLKKRFNVCQQTLEIRKDRHAFRFLLFFLAVAVGLQNLSAAPTPTPTPPPGIITMGETNVLSVGDSGNGNLLCAQQAILSQTATLQSLSFYVNTAGGNLILGVYDATGTGGAPGLLKATTASFTPVVGWNKVNVVQQVGLPAGT